MNASKRKLLGPPKGLEDARAAVLAGRFSEPEPEPEPDEPEDEVRAAPAPAVPPAESAAAAAPAPVKPSRSRPPTPGMVRQTYYMAQPTVDALEEAVGNVRAQLGPLGSRVATHEILAAIVSAGIADPAGVATALRKQLLGG